MINEKCKDRLAVPIIYVREEKTEKIILSGVPPLTNKFNGFDEKSLLA